MTRQEALAILGLREGATRDEILTAYRALMSKVHPDKPGGSNYLASQINQAKKVLIP
jgi:curved DNA-binding protein CbpA